ncbi:hypothetical protein BV20DRAFT_950334 [Pilatotrama ljubarskyi]|nr:hypothetical protein BV20DRAFT_950334 [Pilatotrama ljubarskyi]
MDDTPTRSTATLLFSFLLGFLGLSCVVILGGLLWPRVAGAWRRHVGHPRLAGSPIDLPTTPKLWDICVRDALLAAKLSDCAWEQLQLRECLQPLALRVTSAAADFGATGTSRLAKWNHSPLRPKGLAIQTNLNRLGMPEDGIALDGCRTAIAMVIAYPACAIKAELGEFALGISHTLCSEPHDGRDLSLAVNT